MISPPVATYRLQLTPDFGFAAAAEIVPYLRDLGVSHLYLSPVFEAVRGSTHGYDVVDPNHLREELGGEHGFRALAAHARQAGLGLVIDIVPHHLSATAANRWWWSVLELGPGSPFSGHFDIDWDPPERRLRGSVLLPVLPDHYGRVLDAGDLRLSAEAGRLVARSFDTVAPLSPETAAELWAEAERAGIDIDDVLERVNADVDRLDAILERQHHRFARWQAAAHDLDYRRFFDVDSLVALRTERVAVFEDTHRLTTALVTEGLVDGLRVDHVDGLCDPAAYLARLRASAPDAWIVVEKILRRDEALPESWPVGGTTGYEFLGITNGLLLDPDGVVALIAAYAEFTGDESTYADTAVDARREVLRDALAADLERVVTLLVQVCEHNRRWRDFTRAELRDALIEVCAHTPGYRSYVDSSGLPSAADRAFVASAIVGAANDRPDLDQGLLEFIRQLLLGELEGEREVELVARFQQLTGPVAAKGEEDTAFYRWTPLLCLNEVGTEPDAAVVGPDEFHASCRRRLETWPSSLLAASTHDTKRSEDVRARLAVLSERPSEWAAAVDRWAAMNDRHRDHTIDAPDRRDEWFIYQTLAGAHPLPFERAWTVVRKSLREAKRRTSWIRSDEDYEAATERFLRQILDDAAFTADLAAEVAELIEPGERNSLALTALRMLAPGVPDIYQGTELWDRSLVDPDNRRPVDSAVRADALVHGHPKLDLIRTCLAVRRRHPDAFGPSGSYDPLTASGVDADQMIGFVRGDDVAVAVPRLCASGPPDDAWLELPPGVWLDAISGNRVDGGPIAFSKLTAAFPVAVLERDLDPIG